MNFRDGLDLLERLSADRALRHTVDQIEALLAEPRSVSEGVDGPLYFFNASTRIHRLSINAAISLMSSWKLRSLGHPVRYLVCDHGMEQCILGTNRMDLSQSPPCKHCVRFSRLLFPEEMTISVEFDSELARELADSLLYFDLEACQEWEFEGIPLGELVLPGLRWSLRRFHLEKDAGTLALYKQFLVSAASLTRQFSSIFASTPPRALIVFNGLTYPEAVARHVATGLGFPVYTHEVGLRPYSAFFSRKDATFRKMDLDPGFELSPRQEQELDRYLAQRFRGNTTMAGIQFWPEMGSLSEQLKRRIEGFDRRVAVFTNVIFDTSQVHANTIYADMFAWLDDLAGVMRSHPEILFILRAHPDEFRPGKESQESVTQWVNDAELRKLDNVLFLSPSDTTSSYEIAELADLILVYNSSIGLEAAIMGKPVLCAGRARYSDLPIVHFPDSRAHYLERLESFLNSNRIPTPKEARETARRFLFFELFRASLDFSKFLQPYPRAKGMVTFVDPLPGQLRDSEALDVIANGLLHGEEFQYQTEAGPRPEASEESKPVQQEVEGT